ncbi:hypothetical protein EJB05_45923, partial [Eragrostis curvula]
MGDGLPRAAGPIVSAEPVSPTPRAVVRLPPPRPSHLIDPRPGPNTGSDDATPRFYGGLVHAASGDGLLLLDFSDARGLDRSAAAYATARAVHFRVDLGAGEGPDFLRFVCNPLSGDMFRLPDAGGTKKCPGWHSHGLLTRPAHGHGPPDRYAVAEMRVDRCAEGMAFTVRRFLSQTGKWDSSFALDNDTGCWTLEHRMSLSSLCPREVRPWQEDAPRIAVVDPLNASVMHITIGNDAFAVDMDKEKVLGCSSINDEADGSRGAPRFFKPCVLPPWLGSSQIPSPGDHLWYKFLMQVVFIIRDPWNFFYVCLQELIQAARPMSKATLYQTFWFA